MALIPFQSGLTDSPDGAGGRAASPKVADGASALTGKSKLRVLVVEDDVAAGAALGELLTYFGCAVTRATTVAAASSAVSSGEFQFVLLDLMLPDGEGTTVLKLVRSRASGAKVVIISATADQELLKRVRAERPDVELAKPLDFSKLAAFMGLKRSPVV